MAYVKARIPTEVYHLTKRENVESIRTDKRIRRFGDTECWFCRTPEDMLRYIIDDRSVLDIIYYIEQIDLVGKTVEPIYYKDRVEPSVSQPRCNWYRNPQMEQKRKCSDPCGISEAEGKGAAEDYCVPAVTSDSPGYRS